MNLPKAAYKYLLYLKCSLSSPLSLDLLIEGVWWSMAVIHSSKRLQCSFSNVEKVHESRLVVTGFICKKTTYVAD